VFKKNQFKIFFFIITIIVISSCKEEVKIPELNIGVPQKNIELDISGNNLPSFINAKLLSDTSRNLIKQLGEYKFSTSIDPANSEDNRYNPDVHIFYEYEGIELKYVGKGAGLVKREELQSTIEEYSKSFYLDEIFIEPKSFKGSLPKGLTVNSTPEKVEKILGKHNPFFDGSNTEKLSYRYPEHGLFIVFNSYPGSVSSDSSIAMITIMDPIKEMERYPTLYPNK
jgi:hypothetical protein